MSGHGTGGGARIPHNRSPAFLRADSVFIILATSFRFKHFKVSAPSLSKISALLVVLLSHQLSSAWVLTSARPRSHVHQKTFPTMSSRSATRTNFRSSKQEVWTSSARENLSSHAAKCVRFR
ncbi:hypothetical protein PoB_003829900 [Plakobranchus ocellatus]|uniref:Uncharacterized protein n=1 Tax=Plakobranchus ocellatus TaxID=259542 RepID=A0AAV4AVI9_9GAST|nr:hypothetical protein PoB_003829900 [Plakobranchus ocellatus]